MMNWAHNLNGRFFKSSQKLIFQVATKMFSPRSPKTFSLPFKYLIRHLSAETILNPPGKCNLVASKLASRSLIRVGGPDAINFLQGIITNDIHHLETKPAIYSLLLNHQGRVLYDAILYSTNTSGETLLECDTSIKTKLMNHLKLYRVRKKVEITDASKLQSIWVVFDSGHTYVSHKSLVDGNTCNYSSREADQEVCCSPIVSHSSKRQELPIPSAKDEKGVEGVGDPRVEELGWRVLVDSSGTSAEKLFKDIKVLPEDHYKQLRYALGIGEGTADLPPGNCFPLESNGDYLHGISFQKGCYIGQELTARTHHTGIVRKRLMPFRLLPPGTIPEGVDISTLKITGADGKALGKVRGIANSYGLSLSRIEETLASPVLNLEGQEVTVVKPLWWPLELSKESQVHKK